MNVTNFWVVLKSAQEYISLNYAELLSSPEKLPQLKAYLEKYVRDKGFSVEGYTTRELVDKLYQEMAEYSILTPYLGSKDLEEINVNAWNDIALTYHDGRVEKAPEHFNSPQHATDIIKKLLQHSKMIIDDARPVAQGHLPNNTRITVLKNPIVDSDVGISASIRLLHPSRINYDTLLQTDFATEEMLEFLTMCLRYGVSMVIAGGTSSGKTTLLNALLNAVPDDKRIFSIESGARELALVHKTESGEVINNVVHTLSKSSDNAKFDISQEDLVVYSLRFNPDIVCVGEMRDTEAYSAVEASLTGHTVVSTIHSFAADAAHMRLALLCQKKFPIDFDTSLMQAGQAFPLVVYTHKLEDYSRKIMDITECEILPNGERRYNTLYRYDIKENVYDNGEYKIKGEFKRENEMSASMKKKLLQFGVPQNELNKFCRNGGV